MRVHVANAHGRPRSEAMLHSQIGLLHVWISEIRNEHVKRLAPGPGASCGRSREPVWICDERSVVAERRSGQKYELSGDSVRDQCIGDIQQVFLNKENSERPADYGVTFAVQ